MQTLLKYVLGFLVIGALIVVASYFLVIERTAAPVAVTSFEECVSAGYEVFGDENDQCRTPDDQIFTATPNVPGLSRGQTQAISEKADIIVLETPQPLVEIASPLTLEGRARGMWYFEATFPVRVEDANGIVLGQYYAEATDDWMTEAFVPFRAELPFTPSQTPTGTLVLEKSNPSGLPERADELRIPIRFGGVQTEPSDGPKQTLRLYYYNPALDTDSEGTIMCSAAGLVAVERSMPVTQTPIQDAVRLLLRGELTAEERAQGIETEYPLPGVQLLGANVKDGVLTLSFADPNNRTSGGACRASILWAQIEKTALEYDVIKEVRFEPEELFQP